MSAFHEFKCNVCAARATAIYNGEHFLPPLKWYSLYDPYSTQESGEHICAKCYSRLFKFKESEDKEK